MNTYVATPRVYIWEKRRKRKIGGGNNRNKQINQIKGRTDERADGLGGWRIGVYSHKGAYYTPYFLLLDSRPLFFLLLPSPSFMTNHHL